MPPCQQYFQFPYDCSHTSAFHSIKLLSGTLFESLDSSGTDLDTAIVKGCVFPQDSSSVLLLGCNEIHFNCT